MQIGGLERCNGIMKEFLASAKGKIIIAASAAVVAAVAVCVFLFAGSDSGYRNISITEVYGSVTAENGGKTYEAYKNMRLAGGYVLTTDSDSYSRMVLDDDKYMKLEQLSRALFEDLGSSKQRRTSIRLENGALTTEIVSPLSEDEDFIVNTPNAVLAVRGTFFRVEVRFDEDGVAYTDVYTYGGKVVCKRVLPDGAVLDEEVAISAGYKARIKMDDVITVYVEELAEESEDNVDPIDVNDISDGILVDIYNASLNGHEMFLTTAELWHEIKDRNIDLGRYRSVYDGGDIPPYDGEEINTGEAVGPDGDITEETPPDPPEEADPDGDGEDEPPAENEQGQNGGNGTDGSEPAVGQGGENPEDDDPTEDDPEENTDNGKDENNEDNENGENDPEDDPGESGSGSGSDSNSGSGSGSNSGSGSGSDDTDEADPEAVLYLDNGSIIITSTGYSQDGGAEIPHTGDYTIAQQSTSAVTASITVQSGTHNITLDGVNITESADVLKVSSGASVTLKGTGTIAAASGNGVDNGGSLTVSSGSYIISSSSGYALSNSGTFRMSGGSFEASGSGSDIGGSGSFVVTGGSLKATSVGAGAAFTNAHGDPLVCETFTSLPSSAALTFRDYDGTSYTYALTAADVSSDGKYYVWKPAFDGTIKLDDGSVTITSTGFTQNGKTINYTGPLTITQDSTSALSNSITVSSGTHDITLDGVNISAAFTISSGATVNLYGGSATNTIATETSGTRGIGISGTLTVNSGSFDVSSSLSVGVHIYNGATFIMKGGTLSASCTAPSSGTNGISINGSGTLTVEGGELNVSSTSERGIYSSGTININGGTLNATGANCGLYLSNSALNVTAGTLDVSSPATYPIQNSTATVTISGGTVRSTSSNSGGYGYYSTYSGTTLISGGDITFTGVYGIGLRNGSTFTVSGGRLKATGTRQGVYYYLATSEPVSVFRVEGGSLEVSGGTYDAGSSNSTSIDDIFIVSGGSLKLDHNTVYGTITNTSGTLLECFTLTSYPGNITAAGYTYYLKAEDKAADGNYYVWLPAGTTIP